MDVDAIVIGSGPNGLVAANVLADAGWSVVVLEASDSPGGAVRSGRLTADGFVNDLFSSFYPLAAASPAIGRLSLEDWGLRWMRGPMVVAHPALDGSCPALGTFEQTMATLDPADRQGWAEMIELGTGSATPCSPASPPRFRPCAPRPRSPAGCVSPRPWTSPGSRRCRFAAWSPSCG